MDKDCIFCEVFRTGKSVLTGKDTHNGLPLIVGPTGLMKLEHFWIKREEFEVTPNHLLVITKRHVNSMIHFNDAECVEFVDAIKEAYYHLFHKVSAPMHINVGINQGRNAGQTIPHFHAHVFDRCEGDTPSPRGGIRNFLPNPIKRY